MMAEPTTLSPATVNDSPIQAQVSTALRDIGVVVGALVALAGCARTHDLAGAIKYLQSAPGISASGIVLSVGIMAWRQWHARRAVKVVTAAVTNPGSVQLKSETTS